MDVLGISAWDGPSAACLVRDGRIVAAAREDCFSRRAGDPDFPRQAIEYCLRAGKIGPATLDAAALSGLERYPGSPGGAPSLLRRLGIGRGPSAAEYVNRELDPAVPVRPVQRTLAHAAGAFRPSPFRSAAIVLLEESGVTVAAGTDQGVRVLSTEEGAPESAGDVLGWLGRARQRTGCDDVAVGGPGAGRDHVLEALSHGDSGSTWLQSAAAAGADAVGAALENAAAEAPPGRPLGPGYNAHQIRTFLRSREITPEELPRDSVAERVAELLRSGRTIGWFAGRVGLGADAVASRALLTLDSAGGTPIVAAARSRDLFETGAAPASAWAYGRRRGTEDAGGVFLQADPEANRALHGVLQALEAAGVEPVVDARPLARPGEPVAYTPRDGYEAFEASGADAIVMERYLVERSRPG